MTYYGLSVGGDCLEFIPSESSEFIGGYYDFTLMNDVDNAIVADDVESVEINGKESSQYVCTRCLRTANKNND